MMCSGTARASAAPTRRSARRAGSALIMTTMNMIQALNSAMDVMMERDNNVVIFGEDVGYFGGVFRATAGLQKKYGKTRVFDTPIAEGGILGTAIGMGAYGLRPVVEVKFADYIRSEARRVGKEGVSTCSSWGSANY